MTEFIRGGSPGLVLHADTLCRVLHLEAPSDGNRIHVDVDDVDAELLPQCRGCVEGAPSKEDASPSAKSFRRLDRAFRKVEQTAQDAAARVAADGDWSRIAQCQTHIKTLEKSTPQVYDGTLAPQLLAETREMFESYRNLIEQVDPLGRLLKRYAAEQLTISEVEPLVPAEFSFVTGELFRSWHKAVVDGASNEDAKAMAAAAVGPLAEQVLPLFDTAVDAKVSRSLKRGRHAVYVKNRVEVLDRKSRDWSRVAPLLGRFPFRPAGPAAAVAVPDVVAFALTSSDDAVPLGRIDLDDRQLDEAELDAVLESLAALMSEVDSMDASEREQRAHAIRNAVIEDGGTSLVNLPEIGVETSDVDDLTDDGQDPAGDPAGTAA